jgi:hypothetical protein
MSFFDQLTLSPKGKIGGIEIQATLEETHTDNLQVTEHPVEQGAAITDHAYKMPSEVVLRCGWSNSSLKALTGAASALFSGGSASVSDYVGGIYTQLLKLQESRVPFDITTSKRQYTNMLITGMQVTTDNRTSNMLMVQVTCRQIIIASTQATTLPPNANQADAQKTGEVQNNGVQNAKPATPSPGGSLPPFDSGSGGGW